MCSTLLQIPNLREGRRPIGDSLSEWSDIHLRKEDGGVLNTETKHGNVIEVCEIGRRRETR